MYLFCRYEPRSYPCVQCGKRTRPGERRNVSGDAYKNFRKYLFKNFMINVKDTDVSCSKCRNIFYRSVQSKHVQHVTVCEEPAYQPPTKAYKHSLHSPRNISLPLQSVKGPSHSSCCFCKRRGHKFVVVPQAIRHSIFLDKNIIIPSSSRCCPGHIVDGALKDDLIMSDLKSHSDFNRTDILHLLQQIRIIALKNQNRRIDFDDSSMSNVDYNNLIGLDKASFDDICFHVSDIRHSKNRSVKTCIGIFLTKLRSGMSNRLLSTVFNIGIDSIKRSVLVARKALARDFTPNYVGFEHISRQEVSDKHTTDLAKILFGSPTEPAILVVDGTYIYIQKSSKFSFQRRSFSMHKKRPLVKPMIVVTSTGYYVSVLGPYLSDNKNNDAKILMHAIESNLEQMKTWLHEDDVMIIDRGFRDSLEFLHELGIKTEMPCFLNKGEKQHTVRDSNCSRLTTKIRWIVESANGRIKSWKYLANVVQNTQIPHIGDDVRLVCAISNKYMKPLCSSSTSDQSFGCRLLYLCKQNNLLMERVQNEELDKREKSKWDRIDASENFEIEFPKLDEDDLRNITLGVYQLKLAQSYNYEHHHDDGQYDILVNKHDKTLLMAKIQSRHISKKNYKLWIEYDEFTVKGWYCQCKSGSRVVGTCAHIAATIWYLGFARHHQLKFDSRYDWSLHLKDASEPEPQLVDDDDDVNDGDGGVEE